MNAARPFLRADGLPSPYNVPSAGRFAESGRHLLRCPRIVKAAPSGVARLKTGRSAHNAVQQGRLLSEMSFQETTEAGRGRFDMLFGGRSELVVGGFDHRTLGPGRSAVRDGQERVRGAARICL